MTIMSFCLYLFPYYAASAHHIGTDTYPENQHKVRKSRKRFYIEALKSKINLIRFGLPSNSISNRRQMTDCGTHLICGRPISGFSMPRRL